MRFVELLAFICVQTFLACVLSSSLGLCGDLYQKRMENLLGKLLEEEALIHLWNGRKPVRPCGSWTIFPVLGRIPLCWWKIQIRGICFMLNGLGLMEMEKFIAG